MSTSPSHNHPMIPVHEALQKVLRSAANYLSNEDVSQLENYESLPLNEALDRCSALDVYAPYPIPRVPTSIMDGFCINFDDCESVAIVNGYSVAGRSSVVLPDGVVGDGFCEARYITTGAALPHGFDTVVPIEKVKCSSQNQESGSINFISLINDKDHKRLSIALPNISQINRGEWTRKVGSDLEQNSKIVEHGQTIGPIEIGILAQCGYKEVKVRLLPKVGVLSTGDELLNVDETSSQNAKDGLEAGMIFDTNRPSLLALIRRFGGDPIDLKSVKDNFCDLKTLVRHGLENCDVLVTSGGISMGEFDLIEKVLVESFGASLQFGRIHMKPGKPTTFFTINSASFKSKFILSLPGNPVSAVVCSHLFLQPLINILRVGCKRNHAVDEILSGALVHPEIDATLTNDLKLDIERPEYHRVSLNWDNVTCNFLATSTGMQRSSRFMSMGGAMGLMCLPKGDVNGKRICKAGEVMPVLLIDGQLASKLGFIKLKNSRHATGKCYATPETGPKENDHLNIGILCLGITDTTDGVIHRVKSSMRAISVISSIALDSFDDIMDVVLVNDDSVNIYIVVVSSQFRANLDASNSVSRCIEKSADALALRMKQGGVKQNGLSALLEFAAGSIKGKMLLMIPEIGLEGALKEIEGKLILHAVSISQG